MGIYTDGKCSVANAIAADVYSSTETGAGVDAMGYEYALVVVNVGVFGASATMDVKVQSSDASGSGFADVTGAEFTQLTVSNDQASYYGVVRLHGSPRYLRVVATYGGSGNCDLGVSFVLLGKGRDTDDAAAAFQVNG